MTGDWSVWPEQSQVEILVSRNIYIYNVNSKGCTNLLNNKRFLQGWKPPIVIRALSKGTDLYSIMVIMCLCCPFYVSLEIVIGTQLLSERFHRNRVQACRAHSCYKCCDTRTFTEIWWNQTKVCNNSTSENDFPNTQKPIGQFILIKWPCSQSQPFGYPTWLLSLAGCELD